MFILSDYISILDTHMFFVLFYERSFECFVEKKVKVFKT